MTTRQTFLEDARTHQTIPVTNSFYTDTLTPIHMFHALNKEAVYMLESQDPESPWSNFSFIGIDPMLSVEQENGSFVIHDLFTQKSMLAPTLQQAFDQSLEYLQVKEPDIPVPFRGGAVGYIAYDAISDVEPVPRAIEDDIPVSNYHLLFCQTLIAYDHKTKETTLVHFSRLPEDASEKEIMKEYDHASERMKELQKKMQEDGQVHDLMLSSSPDTGEGIPLNSNYSYENFIADVEKIKHYIRAGDIFQAVLSQRFEAETRLQGFQLYRVLRKVNPSPYMFYLRFRDLEVIGSSPERLLQVQNGLLEIHPIAGTRKRGADQEEDDALAEELLADEKERAEHRMLVDLARNDIGRVAGYGTVAVPEYMTIGRFSKVMHIISKVTGKLKEGIHPIDALYAAFPAGTLSGAPKVRAMQILRELEPTPRHLYGGGVVYLGYDGNIDSCITIRTMTLYKGKIYIQAGAGIVADSDPAAEYEETLNKASALKKTIELAEQIFEKRREGVEER
ncbi:anthranilate synthase component I [Thalassobacillus pellis]|uniref:anthranilate synthase component I n=1 Tax=Thalassobacillus pellis TaxID=748008 RepID=UPI0019620E24|nr:anthranilate synthase component I [Thalassobacillus pellis]MBM7553754.1 anthranilate synthase component 1 [Thalassobacillus pellis]